jgi:hypothetical protein
MGKCNVFNKKKLRQKCMCEGRFCVVALCRHVVLLLDLLGIFIVAQGRLAKQILSYQQVIHNGELFIGPWLPIVEMPELWVEGDMGLCKYL